MKTNPMTDQHNDLISRITQYLSSGGLFNPEMAIHANVRDLLIDCRDALSAEPRPAKEQPTIRQDRKILTIETLACDEYEEYGDDQNV